MVTCAFGAFYVNLYCVLLMSVAFGCAPLLSAVYAILSCVLLRSVAFCCLSCAFQTSMCTCGDHLRSVCGRYLATSHDQP